jgi:hypothetical protein
MWGLGSRGDGWTDGWMGFEMMWGLLGYGGPRRGKDVIFFEEGNMG